jgi:hypothetical protein
MGLRAILKKLDVHDSQAVYQSIRSRPLKRVARGFNWNNRKVAHLIALPVDLVARQIALREAWRAAAENGQKSPRRRVAPDSLAIDAEKEITVLKRTDQHYARGLQTLFQAAAVLAWTTAESCLKDIWITCVSECPDRVPPEMTKKVQISASDLFALRLDARNHVGDLLGTSFSFDNPQRIREAYKALFQANIHPHLEHAIKRLHTLHQVRNLIVHRGGIVDARFRANTHYRTLVGKPFLLSERRLVEYANLSTHACKKALEVADGWLPPTRKRRAARSTI